MRHLPGSLPITIQRSDETTRRAGPSLSTSWDKDNSQEVGKMENINFVMDGKPVKAQTGNTILQVARKTGIDIPTLCFDERLAPYGGCRLCTVEILKNNRSRLVTSCVYPAEEGLVVKTYSPKVVKIRKLLIELLLPLSPTGPLESLGKKYGVEKSRFTAVRTNCILCGLCVRYCAEVKKANAIGFIGRGTEREIAVMPGMASSTCAFCKECFNLCPGGKIVSEIIEGNWIPGPRMENK